MFDDNLSLSDHTDIDAFMIQSEFLLV